MDYRRAGLADVPLITAYRKQQLIDEGSSPDVDIDKALLDYHAGAIANGSLVEWLVVDDGEVVATGAVIFQQHPPSYSNPAGRVAYVTNMYTRPDHRRQGLATSLLSKLMDECRARDCRVVWLRGSHDGLPVYAKFGFVPLSNAMVMKLSQESHSVP